MATLVKDGWARKGEETEVVLEAGSLWVFEIFEGAL